MGSYPVGKKLGSRRRIAVITGSRSEYGLLYWVLREIENDPDLELQLIITGMHLSPEFGLTVQEIERDGFQIHERVEMLLSSDTPVGVAKSIGLGVIGFADVWARLAPDIILVLGDRFEVFAAVSAALPLRIPVAHIHGGESTEGAIDDVFRHAITKMSHIHFPANEFHAERLKQMGEAPWRIFICGSPGVDYIKKLDLYDREELQQQLGINLNVPTLLVTYHPVTLEYTDTEIQIENLLKALEAARLQIVFTYPNADAGSRTIIAKIQHFIEEYPNAKLFINLGQRAYLSLLKYVSAMVGNSSSGLLEAPSFSLPVVNVGSRESGRIRARNVIDVGYSREDILNGILKALDVQFRETLKDLENPYGDGDSSSRIVRVLKSIRIDDHLLRKRFDNERPVERSGS